MFIQTIDTPNPQTMKFLPGQDVLGSGTADFPTREAAGSSPLAQRIFAIDGVTGVMLGSDFISVTKSEQLDWDVLKPPILAAIMEHLTRGEDIILGDKATEAKAPTASAEDEELIVQIVELIETHIRPAVAGDGGDITFESYKDGVVYVQLKGACSGCPSASLTLKQGIENLLCHYVPEVTSVEAVNE